MFKIWLMIFGYIFGVGVAIVLVATASVWLWYCVHPLVSMVVAIGGIAGLVATLVSIQEW